MDNTNDLMDKYWTRTANLMFCAIHAMNGAILTLALIEFSIFKICCGGVGLSFSIGFHIASVVNRKRTRRKLEELKKQFFKESEELEELLNDTKTIIIDP